MNDSIEQQIARLKLPDASPNLDRRIDELFRSQPNRQQPESRRGISALVLACGSVAAALIGLMLPDRISEQKSISAPPPAVVNVEVRIPLLNVSENEFNPDETILLAPESLVVTIETNDGEEE